MRKNLKFFIITTLIATIVGLVLGYLFFGKSPNGNYMDISKLFFPNNNALIKIGNALSNAASMRWNVLLSGILGFSVGVNIYYFFKKK